MNALLASFVAEARDLLAEAGSDLLALERAPADEAAINRLFRSVHTLKGSSGLFDVPPLTRILHAAEDMFMAVREQGLPLGPEMVDLALTTLDQTGHWIDQLERTESLPPNAGSVASQLAAKLRACFDTGPKILGPVTPTAAGGTAETSGATWQDIVSLFGAGTRAAAAAGGGPVHLVAYSPEAGCFFKGEDPLHLALQIPRMIAFTAVPRAPWNALADFDPFDCNVDLFALSAAGAEPLEALFRYVPEQVTITLLAQDALQVTAAPRLDVAALLLAEQIEILKLPAPEDEFAGRLAASARVAVNTLHTCGRADDASGVEAAAIAAQAGGDAALLGDAIAAALAALRMVKSEPEASDAAPDSAGTATGTERSAPRTLRIDQEKIDTLMNLVGELIVAKNSLPFLARRAEQEFGLRDLSREISDQYGVIDHIAQELQSAIMAVRMMPISQVFQRFPRLVRDLARKLGKQVDLVIEGEDTEADKNVIENLFDPLLHMVRNSLDHGVETPAERTACGKPATATVKLLARHDSDQVVIEIADDGRGIDPELVKRTAHQRGLLDDAQLAAIGDDAARMLVFGAGFSTAGKISDVSGRGVGMDVVRNAIEKAGGRIALTSTTGAGTTFRLNLPLSMAVRRVMTVTLHGRLLGIPMDLIHETVRVPRRDILRIKAHEAFVLRDCVVPMLRLAKLLELDAPQEDEDIAVLVVRVSGQTIGLAVSAFGEGMEVILKPLEGMLSKIAGYAGTALLGDGRVLLVLDLKELMA